MRETLRKLRTGYGPFFVFSCALLVAACGGSSGGSSTESSGDTPSDDQTTALYGSSVTGPVSAIPDAGSIVLNGQSYDVSQLNLIADESAIEVGTVVQLWTDGASSRVVKLETRTTVVGPITEMDTASNTVTVLGQVVVITDRTSFSARLTADQLAVGNVIRVSGLRDSQGRVIATRIKRDALAFTTGLKLELEGLIENFNIDSKTFTVGGITIDFSNAEIVTYPGLNLGDGVKVEIYASMPPQGDILVVDRIKLSNPRTPPGPDAVPDAAPPVELSVGGLIMEFIDASTVVVDGQVISFLPETRFIGGGINDLTLDSFIIVHGVVNAFNVLEAGSVFVRKPDEVAVDAYVEAVDPVQNTVTVLGATFVVDNLTSMFVDLSNLPVDIPSVLGVPVQDIPRVQGNTASVPFQLADLIPGDRIRIGAAVDNGVLVATKIVLRFGVADTPVMVKGPIDALADPTFSVAGILVHTDANTVFLSKKENPLTPADFFGTLTNGFVVMVSGQIMDTMYKAARVQVVGDPAGPDPGPGAVPADPGTPPADPGTPPADPGTPPADPGTPPADPGTPPADPGTPPADPGTPPADPPAPFFTLTGNVTALDPAAGTFTVHGVTFTVTLDTVFEFVGLEAPLFGSLLTVGDLVTVEATSGATGLVATLVTVTLPPLPQIELQGRLSASDAAAQTFTVEGITFGVDANTVFRSRDGQSMTSDEFFGRTDVVYVAVSAVVTDTGFLATDVQVVEIAGPQRFEIRGTVDVLDATARTITLSGVTIGVDADTEFFAVDGAAISVDQFFALTDVQAVTVSAAAMDTGGLIAVSVHVTPVTVP